MKRILFLFTLPLTLACDDRRPQPDIKTEKGTEIAKECINQMTACADWDPVEVVPETAKPKDEDCEAIENNWEHEKCVERNDARRSEYYRYADKPKHRSPCQQRADACVELVRAVTGQATHETVTNNYHKN